jgi:predicted DNA-binding protein
MSVSFPEQISSELESFATETGRSKSDIIKESVALYLWDVRFNSLKKSMMRRAKKVGIVTEEDVFRALA